MSKKKFYILLIGLHLFGFCYQIYQPSYLTLDSDDYIFLAENFWNLQLPYSGDIGIEVNLDNLENKGLFASRPILYSLFLLLTGGLKSPLFTLFAQNILSVLSIYMADKMFEEQGFKLNYLMASLALLFFPSIWIYANWIMAETLFMFLIICWLRAVFQQKLILASAFISLALLTKPAILYLLILWMAYCVVQLTRRRKALIVLAIIIPLITWRGQIIINKHYTGLAIFSSMPGINLVQYNAKYTLSDIYGMDSALNWVDQLDKKGVALEAEKGFKHSYPYKKNAATKVIVEHLPTYLLLHLKGSLRWTIDPGRFDILNFFKIYHEGGNQGWMRTYYSKGIRGLWQRAMDENLILLILIIAITAWNIFRLYLFSVRIPTIHTNPLFFYFIFLVVGYFAAISGPVASARFLVPVFPLILCWVSTRKPSENSIR